MSEGVLFTIGLLLGSVGGIMTMAIISVRRTSDLYSEIQDLRTQRKLLRDELVKKQTKPTPRKYRKNKLNV
jgi:hypothetical protein|tara:strand:- start:8 stop:220 length:213 start_codon:yes stop_codon:yes gene_type:complete